LFPSFIFHLFSFSCEYDGYDLLGSSLYLFRSPDGAKKDKHLLSSLSLVLLLILILSHILSFYEAHIHLVFLLCLSCFLSFSSSA
jgi:hypothetical protein